MCLDVYKRQEQPPAHDLARLYLKGMNDDARQDEIDQQDRQGLAVGAAQLARPYEGEEMCIRDRTSTSPSSSGPYP